MQQTKVGEQNLYNLFGRFSLVLVLLSSIAYAESFADFKRVQTESFTQFKDKRDDEFKKYLKEQWQEYRKYVEVPLYTKPKPKTIVPAKPQKPKVAGPLVNIKLLDNLEPKREIITPVIVKNKSSEISYFGSSIGFSIDEELKNAKYYPHSQKGVANFFTTLASSDYETILAEIKQVAQNLQLNDWGKYLLIKELSRKFYENEDEQKLFTWFILNKLSYNVKVALANQHILLLINSKQTIYATPRYKFKGHYFYVLDETQRHKKIYTYPQDYPDADKSFDFRLSRLPLFQEDKEGKSLYFKEYGKEYSAEFQYNKNLINFFATYPQVSYEVYFSTPMEYQTYRDIAQDLKEYIDGKKASVAIDFLLKFVQKAFIYEVDQEQFSKEKVMFAEETLVYNKSDCEDRAVLFAYLVKNLLGISVVGVKYPDHMATALYIPMQGDSVRVGKRRYVIADPTYINATVGESMPKYRSIKPQKFIMVK